MKFPSLEKGSSKLGWVLHEWPVPGGPYEQGFALGDLQSSLPHEIIL